MIFDYKGSAESTKLMAVSFLKKVIKDGLLSKYGCSSIEEFVKKYADGIFDDFRKAMTRNVGDEDKACPVDIKQLYSGLNCTEEALRGFFIFRAEHNRQTNYYWHCQTIYCNHHLWWCRQ